MAKSATRALADARLSRDEVDGMLCGYATTLLHLMLSTLLCERFVLRLSCAHSAQLGDADAGG